MKKSNHYKKTAGFLFFTVLFSSSLTLACDAVLREFSRDCAIQDKLVKLRADFAAEGVDINEISEYRTLRFIDRWSWENAKTNNIAPLRIYQPAPQTWQVWDRGIRTLFSQQRKGVLGRMRLDMPTVAHINTVLLTNGDTSITDPNTDRAKKPGEYRTSSDLAVGYCNRGVTNSAGYIDEARLSTERFQSEWESRAGMSFRDLVRAKNGPEPDAATLAATIYQDDRYNHCAASSTWVSYSPGEDVEKTMKWIQIFVEENLRLYRANNPALSPVEMAAFVQRWFVTLHPFADGNGRTSRGIQDYIMLHFDMPFVPAGDLQNDAMEIFENYLDSTYSKIESMLNVLETCVNTVDYRNTTAPKPFYCTTVNELNAR